MRDERNEDIRGPRGRAVLTVGAVWRSLLLRPRLLLLRWNWKSALFSSLFRSQVFLAANLSAGRRAALMAMATEFAYRGLASGFYGAVTQAFRNARPPWLALISVLLVLPAAGHAMELLVHWLRHTPNLRTSVIASVCFTFLSTGFNWYAMRRGTLIVGESGRSLAADIRSLPGVVLGFLAAVPAELIRGVAATMARLKDLRS